MSEFDEEAERERLRQKYEQDKQERETTERMSELLLQGATMTNAHCSACGNPVFRYEGQEFCAACEQPVDREDDGDDTAVEVTDPGDGRVVFGDEADESATPGTDGDGTDRTATRGESQTGSDTTTGERDSRGRATDAGEAADGSVRAGDSSPGTPAGRTATQSPEGGAETAQSAGRAETPHPAGGTGEVADASVETARASLVRVLTAASRRAENADDPRRALEHVKLARETAETLATLRR